MNSLKVVYGDEISQLLPIMKSKREPNQKVLVLLPSYISISNCQQSLLKQIQTMQGVLFMTFEDLALKILDESTGYSFDLLDDEVERESVARSLRDTSAFTNISIDLRENPSFISYMTSVLFEIRRNAESVTTDQCILPTKLGDPEQVAELSDFEKEKLQSRAGLSRKLVETQWKILKPFFDDKYYTRELAIAEATRTLSGSSGATALSEISQVFIGHPYHVDDVLFRFIISIAAKKPTTYWVATTTETDNITARLKKDINLEIETQKLPEPSKSILVAAPDMRREIQFIARDVHRRVTSGELRLSDILVVARDSGQYEDVFYEVMGDFGIPSEVQTRQYFKLLAVVHFYESLLKFASGTDREMAESLIEILETGFPGVSEYSTFWMRAKVERLGLSYRTLVSDLKGKKPEDLIGGRATSWWLDQFEKLEKVKERLLKAESIEDFLKILVSSEPRMGIVEYTSRRLQMHEALTIPRGVRSRELEGTLRLLKRLWSIRDVQRQVNQAMDVSKVDIKRFQELFEDFSTSESYGTSPQSREVLRMVDAGNIDFLRPKTMYMVGLSEGIFPSKIRETAFFGDRASKLLTEKGVAYFQNSDTTRGYEKWLFTNCIASSSDGLTFTYSYLDAEGRPRLYSPFLLSDGLFTISDLEETIAKRILVDSFTSSAVTSGRDALRLAARTLGGESGGSETWKITFEDPQQVDEFSKISAGAGRIRRPPPSADVGSGSQGLTATKIDIDSLNEFSACQFRYYSRYLLRLDPWKFKAYHRIGKFYFRVLQNLIPEFPKINPTRLKRAVQEELEKRVRSDDIPNERLLRRLGAIIFGYLDSEVQRCRNATSTITSRRMEFARPIQLTIEDLTFEGSYDRVDFLDDDNCIICEIREDGREVQSSFGGLDSIKRTSLPDYRLPFLIEALRREGKNVVGVEYHSIRPSNSYWYPRQAGFVLKDYSKSIAAPDDVVSVTREQLDAIARESMKKALDFARIIQSTRRFRVSPKSPDICETCAFNNLCLGPRGIRE
jgi:hypothetical protein